MIILVVHSKNNVVKPRAGMSKIFNEHSTINSSFFGAEKVIRKKTRMASCRAHTSAKSDDPANLLLVNRCRIKHTQYRGVSLAPPNRNCNHNPTLTLKYTKILRPIYHLSTEVCKNRLSTICVIMLISKQKLTN